MDTVNKHRAAADHFIHVRAENSRGIFASQGPLFKGAIFGRDSVEVAEDLIGIDHVIPREILRTLASLQGATHNPVTEEEPGKIHHEHRTLQDARDTESQHIFQALSGMWGGNEHAFTYYGSVDATPLYVRSLCKYVEAYGEALLDEQVQTIHNTTVTMLESLQAAYSWIVSKIEQSTWGLVEYRRTNPRGIENQVWKDSIEAYVTPNGKPINFDNGVAALEVQCYAYDALKHAGLLLHKPYTQLDTFRQNILNKFWISDKNMFSSTLDRDPSGQLRQLLTPLSNMGLILDSDVLMDSPGDGEKARLTINRLLEPDFLTPAGIRCRSANYSHVTDYPDYHGSFSVWFKESNDIARGCERHGFIQEALLIEEALMTTLGELQEFYEFVFVDANNQIVHPIKPVAPFTDLRCNKPEPGQSWTISTFVRCLQHLQV